MKNTGTAMNYMALRQAIQGKMMIINLGGSRESDEDEEIVENLNSREIFGHAVYHISTAKFNIDHLFKSARFPKVFGTFYHPYLMLGMPEMGGHVTVYVDNRFEGWYVLIAAIKLDTWQNGPSDRALDVVCWTPKQPKDTIAIAGQRLIRSLIYNMDDLEEHETTSDLFQNDRWQDEWNPSTNILGAFIEVRR